DILSLMYLASTALKRYEDDGRPQADKPLLDWAIWDAMFKAQNAFEGVISNYPNRFFAWLLARFIFPIGRPYVVPSDQLGHEVAKLLLAPSSTRNRLTADMYLPDDDSDPVGCLEYALETAIAAESIEAKIRAAEKAGTLDGTNRETMLQAAVAKGVITQMERERLVRAAALRNEVIRVDDFPPDLSLNEAAKENEHMLAV
ncbi:MAG TPA: DUF1974 domain-containing protein, partial [Burkholderiales bacterium]|nr:DUF1974 domain-containing protein [Burkholderiales bacterium]